MEWSCETLVSIRLRFGVYSAEFVFVQVDESVEREQGWLYGSRQGKMGWIPESYVEKQVKSEAPLVAKQALKPQVSVSVRCDLQSDYLILFKCFIHTSCTIICTNFPNLHSQTKCMWLQSHYRKHSQLQTACLSCETSKMHFEYKTCSHQVRKYKLLWENFSHCLIK